MKGIIVVVLMGLCELAFSQQPQPAAPPKGPQLSATEQVALQAISEKMKAAQDQTDIYRRALVQVENDIAKNHPGYHLSEMTGTLEKDLPPKPAAAPEPKK